MDSIAYVTEHDRCPLCFSTVLELFCSDRRRDYFLCRRCELVFVPAHQHVSFDEEKTIYDFHQNDPADPGYRRFVSRLVEPLCARLAPGAEGLDFGCGAGSAAAAMLSERGYAIDYYDPIYAAYVGVLERTYDFVVCVEVVEHFRNPAQSFSTLFGLLKRPGYLAVMTKRVLNKSAFSRWHYKNDMTHVGFYSVKTLTWLAALYRCRAEFCDRDVVIFSLSV